MAALCLPRHEHITYRNEQRLIRSNAHYCCDTSLLCCIKRYTFKASLWKLFATSYVRYVEYQFGCRTDMKENLRSSIFVWPTCADSVSHKQLLSPLSHSAHATQVVVRSVRKHRACNAACAHLQFNTVRTRRTLPYHLNNCRGVHPCTTVADATSR